MNDNNLFANLDIVSPYARCIYRKQQFEALVSNSEKIPINPSVIQIHMSSEDINRRLSAYMEHRQLQNNLSNKREYRDNTTNEDEGKASNQIKSKSNQIKRIKSSESNGLKWIIIKQLLLRLFASYY